MKTALRLGWILLCLTLALAARCWNLRDVFLEGRIYFVDADCYSRMTRAAMVADRPGTIIRHHEFENWPQGVVPHTTAPLDYLIVGLKTVLDGGFSIFDAGETSLLSKQTLDLAGALISPLLGLGGALFFACWLWRFRVRFGGFALLLYAISPIIVHGTLLGRPDHQALLIFLLTVAGGAELALAAPAGEGTTGNRRVWSIVSGVAWALSLWVSLYEPLILLAIVLALWLISNRRALWSVDRRTGVIAWLVIGVLALMLEGWRITLPDAAERTYFARWQQNIGELSPLDLGSPLLFSWLGLGVVLAPILLFRARKLDQRAVPLLVLLVVTFAFTLWQVRWGYFLALVFVWALPWQMQALRRPWQAWLIFLVGLWPTLKDWDTRLFPDERAQDRMATQRIELTALRDVVSATTGENAGPFLAPWWLSPSIAYWTRNPGVAGSSHESLPGIVDSARFFLSVTPESAAAILRARRVRWVLADEPSRVVSTSAALLAVTPPAEALADALMDHPAKVPEFLREWKDPFAGRSDGLRFYRLYQVDDANLPP